jgi:predicted nucleic acid-binding protein
MCGRRLADEIPRLRAADPASARVHNLVLVTRDVADFADRGVDVVDPWAA